MKTTLRRIALVSAVALAVAAVPSPRRDASAKEVESLGSGLKFTVEPVAADKVAKPDPALFRRAPANLGSPRVPRGQWVMGMYKLMDPKTGAAIDPMPDGQSMALLKVEHIAEDLTDKDGKVILKAGRYLSVGLPQFDKKGREKAAKWEQMLDWGTLAVQLSVAVPNAAGLFPNENVFRDAKRIPEDQWAVLSLSATPVVYVEPLVPPKAKKAGGGKDGEGDDAAEPADELDSGNEGGGEAGGEAAGGADARAKARGRKGAADKAVRLYVWLRNTPAAPVTPK